MDRRSFLGGVFGGVTAGGLLIRTDRDTIQAAESGLIIPESPVIVAHQFMGVRPGEILFDFRGHPVCVIENITYSTEMIDVTSAYDSFQHAPPGRTTGHISAITYGPARIHQA